MRMNTTCENIKALKKRLGILEKKKLENIDMGIAIDVNIDNVLEDIEYENNK